ncbi:MAG TPA: hypothetical protein PKE64_00175 [Anaerolineae bacterium]|nr:hypothetical protein [Anaerolineae bacterium]HMR62401.1 hypothetical protein [Anaerolineae bacterium]
MIKWLQIIGLGIFTWGVTLTWLESNVILMSPLTIGVVVVLVVALPAYSLGRHVGLKTTRFDVRQNLTPQLPQVTSTLVSMQLHTNPTRPITSTRLQGQHSQPTQPMPLVVPH